MKKSIINIFIISLSLTIIGFLMDSDPKEPSMLMRFVEFFGMIAMLSILISTIYFSTRFVYKKVR
ncbi:hypothetical protein ACFQ3R_05255 [Mesonia ostreae]|uniref:Uncharacterized protein n=1 Tax=Mesonia ostreae TaxID=861110 RepID=A0ABU2KK13_9FLAO|nr:hypothetical protein [Mesonia ostreae]MDT0295068.1 hypothetical protein [Mesonia ostreae]